MPEVKRVLKQMKVFTEKVISGEWTGFTGKPSESDLGAPLLRDLLGVSVGNKVDVFKQVRSDTDASKLNIF